MLASSNTQRIKREDSTLHPRLYLLNLRMIRYSKSIKIYDEVIGIFFDREYSL
ncbi:IS1 family transposase [Candidatus Enterovibrio escicola]|uniref:IS1 family transposase n=1 Tax=Candidatus Enterovibrio escicola TaxID=1927127 RepID=UPI0013146841